MGRLVLLLAVFIGWAVLKKKPARRLFGSQPDAFAFPTSAAHHGIDLDDAAMVGEWCRRFDCTTEQLRAAVKAVGTSAEAVREQVLRAR